MKTIKNTNEKYAITEYGRVWSYPRQGTKTEGMFIKTYFDVNGYEVAPLYINGKQKHIKIHRLVAETYIRPIKNKLEINHIDGNKQNNHISNLEWVDRSENIQHAYNLGLRDNVKYSKGRTHYLSKINEKIAIEMRRFKQTGCKIREIAIICNVSESCVKNVLYRGDWSE